MDPMKRIVKAKSTLRNQPISWAFIPKASKAGSVTIARLNDKSNIMKGTKK